MSSKSASGEDGRESLTSGIMAFTAGLQSSLSVDPSPLGKQADCRQEHGFSAVPPG